MSDLTYAKVIADSISPITHDRATTLEVRCHRFVLAEFNTHRVFSRNSASSRAIPVKKMLERVSNETAVPMSWPAEQRGMQGGEAVAEEVATLAKHSWLRSLREAVSGAERLVELGVHKSVANRLIEPFAMHTIVVTATAWENFFAQRCSPLAQPEIRAVAEKMREVREASIPDDLDEGEWHLPYVDLAEVDSLRVAVRVSAARCARVSYLTQDGVRSVEADLELYERLVSARPAHWSPLEHVATPDRWNRQTDQYGFRDMDGVRRQVNATHLPKVGNLLGWRSLRTEVEASLNERTFA